MKQPVFDKSGSALSVDESGGEVPTEIDFVNAVFRQAHLEFTSCGQNNMECKLLFLCTIGTPDACPGSFYIGVELVSSDEPEDLPPGYYEGPVCSVHNRAELYKVTEQLS